MGTVLHNAYLSQVRSSLSPLEVERSCKVRQTDRQTVEEVSTYSFAGHSLCMGGVYLRQRGDYWRKSLKLREETEEGETLCGSEMRWVVVERGLDPWKKKWMSLLRCSSSVTHYCVHWCFAIRWNSLSWSSKVFPSFVIDRHILLSTWYLSLTNPSPIWTMQLKEWRGLSFLNRLCQNWFWRLEVPKRCLDSVLLNGFVRSVSSDHKTSLFLPKFCLATRDELSSCVDTLQKSGGKLEEAGERFGALVPCQWIFPPKMLEFTNSRVLQTNCTISK